MDPERKRVISGKTVSEFYWAGEYPVYVDSRLAEGNFETVCARLEAEQDVSAHEHKDGDVK